MAARTPEHHELHADKSTKNPKHKLSSPNIKARVQEKEELSDLNDRLAAYIDRVRSLESQNAKLSVEVNQAKDSCTREVGNIKAMYEAELAESRRLLDDTSKEKALLKLENNKLNGILVDLRPKLEQEQASNKRLQGKLRGVERRLNEKENLLAVYTNEKVELQNRVKDLEEQLDELEAKLAKDKDQLEKEIIARIDAENRYQTLKEESQFTAQVHQNEVSEARQSVQTHAFSYNVDVSGGSDYECVLQEKLQELREEFEEEAESSKQEMEDSYKMKLEEMKEQSERDRIVISKLLEKQGDINRVIDTLKSDNNVLSSKVEHFQTRIAEMESLRVMDKEDFKHQMEGHDEKYRLLQERYDDLEAEYESLLGIKIALDMELAAYNKLLEGEEQRLNLVSKSGGTQRHSRKRGHRESMEPCIESSSSGAISIADADGSGKFVTITNNGTEDEELGDHFIHRVVDGTDANNGFKFPSNYILPSQHSVTVWSESHGMKENPPNDYVLEGDWLAGGKTMATTIVNTNTDVIAKYTLTMSGQYKDAAAKVRKKSCSSEYCNLM